MKDDKLKEKFSRIYKKSSRIKLEKLDKVYESIKDKQQATKNPSTVAELAKDTSLSKNSVRVCLSHLEKSKYIKRTRAYTPPFLKVTSKKSEAEFIYGQDKRENRVKIERDSIVKALSGQSLTKELQEGLSFIKGNSKFDSKFFTTYNFLVDFLWNKSLGNYFKLEIGSGANKYLLA